MTDEELTKIIAEKVMGWECHFHKGYDLLFRTENSTIKPFDPLYTDNDCMLAWDKFSEMFDIVRLTRKHGNSASCWSASYWGKEQRAYDISGAINTDRRRAMCECMVKATGKDDE